ncbi:MAG: CotH kinase family protein, partial [Actinobacteria bacterium]|nr:CotH kinase family protein [Actinomycetota bacterium]
MFKKRDLVIIIILVALTLAAAAFLVSYRTSFSVGGVAATIDNTNNTIFVSLPEGSGTEQEITFNFPYEAGYIYISRIRQETGSKEVQTLESTTGPGDSGTTSSSRKDTGQSGLEGTQPGQDGTTASSSDFAGEKYTAGIDDEHAVRISSGQSFDFGSFISHCKIETASGEKYDLWVTTGNIPIITIEAGKNIPDEPKVDCTLDVLSPNPSNLTAGIEGEIELTGVSGDIPKSSYSFNIKEDPIMGDTPSIPDFSPSKRFSLSASYTDPSIIREKLAADIFGLMSEDNTAPDSGYVELYLNGKYQGLYLLSRRVDRDMFSIPNYDPENDFPGVIYEAARREADFKMGPEGFSQVEPDYDSETPYMEPLEELISLVMDAPEEGFLKTAYDTLDIENTLDSHILFLLSGCSDPRAANQYIYRNNGSDSKFSFCPGNLYADSFGRRPDSTMVDPAWFFNGSRLFNRLYQEAGYREDLKARYSALREDILTVDNLVSLIDKSTIGLSGAWQRNFTAWPISSQVYEDSMSPEEDVAYIKEYLKDRLTILDDYINNPPILKIGDSYALIN